jgi:chromosome segregation ATPase
MCRKIAIAVGAVLIGLVLVRYSGIVVDGYHQVTAWLDSQVPIDTKIRQLEVTVNQIDNEIDANRKKVAKLDVELENLEQKVVALRQEQAKRKGEMAVKVEKLDKLTQQVAAGKDVNLQNVSSDLDATVKTFKSRDGQLKSLENQLAAKSQTVALAHQKIDGMAAQRDALRTTVEELKGLKEQVEIKTQKTTIQISDSKIAECNRQVKDIRTQLREMEKYADMVSHDGGADKAQFPAKETKPVKEVLESAKEILTEGRDQ